MAATVQGAYFFRNRVRSIPMYIGMSNDFYRQTKIASCAPGFSLLAIPSSLSRSYSTFSLCSGTTLIEIAVYSKVLITWCRAGPVNRADSFV
jgi:hypothetical protein